VSEELRYRERNAGNVAHKQLDRRLVANLLLSAEMELNWYPAKDFIDISMYPSDLRLEAGLLWVTVVEILRLQRSHGIVACARVRTVLRGTVAPEVYQQNSGRVISRKDETSSVVVYEDKLRQCFPQHPTSISVLLISIANSRAPSFRRLSCQNPIELAQDAEKRSCRIHSTYPITPPSPALWHPDAANST
jgi:hypothetical protein